MKIHKIFIWRLGYYMNVLSSIYDIWCFFCDFQLSNRALLSWTVKMLVEKTNQISKSRGSHLEMFLGKGVLKICSKFTGEHPCRSAISVKLQSNFIEITLRHGCSPLNLLYIFRTPFTKNTFWRLLLKKYLEQTKRFDPLSIW